MTLLALLLLAPIDPSARDGDPATVEGLTVSLGRNPPRLFLSDTPLNWEISPFTDLPHRGVPGAEEV